MLATGYRATATLILVGLQKVQPLWRNLWQFYMKISTYWPHDPEISHLNIYQREMKTHVHQNEVFYVYCSFIHNSHKLETNQLSLIWWMGKPIVAYPYNGILLREKKEQNVGAYTNMEESQKPWNKLKKSDTKKSHNAWFNSHEILEMTKP